MSTIKYYFYDGHCEEVECSDKIAEVFKQLNREEWRQDAKRRYYCRSIECTEEFGFQFASSDRNPLELIITEENLFEKEQLLRRLRQAIALLRPSQLNLVLKVWFQGISQEEIARQEDHDDFYQKLFAPLTVKQRKVYVLHHLYNMKQTKIADKLGIAVSSVNERLQTARKNILDFFCKTRKFDRFLSTDI